MVLGSLNIFFPLSAIICKALSVETTEGTLQEEIVTLPGSSMLIQKASEETGLTPRFCRTGGFSRVWLLQHEGHL
jgi:hypothetical protein